ncbi:MAG TPA: NADH-quinone oxidoreductase subunit N, partial [Actinoplanes sp.]|nr:NADH-quinone oxidoreductase subunit N [Actinoplanes sp.]
MGDLKLPAIDYGALLPMLILFGAACVGILVEVFAPRRSRNVIQLSLAFAAVAAA